MNEAFVFVLTTIIQNFKILNINWVFLFVKNPVVQVIHISNGFLNEFCQ